MSKHYGVPGIGGSLGKCAVCGEAFVQEILMNEGIESFSVNGCDQVLYLHDKCKPTVVAASKAQDYTVLPEGGPLRAFYEEADAAGMFVRKEG